MASQTLTPDLSQIVTRWGQVDASRQPGAPRARSLLILAQLEREVAAELGEQAAQLQPLLPLLGAHAEALFSEDAGACEAEVEAEHLAALHLLLDRIEDGVLALGLREGAVQRRAEGPPWT